MSADMIDAALARATDTKACVISDGALELMPGLFREHFSAASRAVVVSDPRTRAAAGELSLPYFTVATAASVDGYSSFGASLRSPEGAKQTYACPAPLVIVADLDVIRTAPDWMAASGFADLMAKVPAGADSTPSRSRRFPDSV